MRRMSELIAVILSGGSGARLWPLSRDLTPKQLLRLVGDRTLLQETALRSRAVARQPAPPIIVCSEAHRFLVAEQLREIGVRPQTSVLEPQGRNTAPALAIAALLARQAGSNGKPAPPARAASEPILLVSPADHVILDTKAFAASVDAAVDAARAGFLVMLGVVADRPETGYGYIERGADQGRWSVVDKFVEKPNLAAAKRYVDSGRYLWNSGMFVCTPSTYLEELERHSNKIYTACVRAIGEATVDDDFTRLGNAFLDCPSDSIDYAVMEKTTKAAVVPLDAGWNDVGSWSALYDMLDKDAAGNVARGDVVLERCKNSYVLSTSRLVAAIGLEDIVVVETADAVAVLPRSEAQHVKTVVDRLKRAGRSEVRDTPTSPAQRSADR
jgi:mannose-1-phosphate guanylyltransferase / mannose-6-phosphate isomerase